MVTGRRQLGDAGERIAAERLLAAGMRIVARNVRTAGGEIDILAEEGDDLVFVEVRTRRSGAGAAAESIGVRKLERMWQCARDYCDEHTLDPERIRVDVVSIDLGDGGRGPIVFEHYRAATLAE